MNFFESFLGCLSFSCFCCRLLHRRLSDRFRSKELPWIDWGSKLVLQSSTDSWRISGKNCLEKQTQKPRSSGTMNQNDSMFKKKSACCEKSIPVGVEYLAFRVSCSSEIKKIKSNYLLRFWPLCIEAQPENMVTPQVADYHHTKILAMARGIGSVSSPLGIQHAQSLPIDVKTWPIEPEPSTHHTQILGFQ